MHCLLCGLVYDYKGLSPNHSNHLAGVEDALCGVCGVDFDGLDADDAAFDVAAAGEEAGWTAGEGAG